MVAVEGSEVDASAGRLFSGARGTGRRPWTQARQMPIDGQRHTLTEASKRPIRDCATNERSIFCTQTHLATSLNGRNKCA